MIHNEIEAAERGVYSSRHDDSGFGEPSAVGLENRSGIVVGGNARLRSRNHLHRQDISNSQHIAEQIYSFRIDEVADKRIIRFHGAVNAADTVAPESQTLADAMSHGSHYKVGDYLAELSAAPEVIVRRQRRQRHFARVVGITVGIVEGRVDVGFKQIIDRAGRRIGHCPSSAIEQCEHPWQRVVIDGALGETIVDQRPDRCRRVAGVESALEAAQGRGAYLLRKREIGFGSGRSHKRAY